MAMFLLRNLIEKQKLNQQEVIDVAASIAVDAYVRLQLAESSSHSGHYGEEEPAKTSDEKNRTERNDGISREDLNDVLDLIADRLRKSSSPISFSTEFQAFVDKVCLQILADSSHVSRSKDIGQSCNILYHQTICEIMAMLLFFPQDGDRELICQKLKDAILSTVKYYSDETKFMKRGTSLNTTAALNDQGIQLTIESALHITRKYVRLFKNDQLKDLFESPWYKELKDWSLSVFQYGEPHICTILSDIILPKCLLSHSTLEVVNQLSQLWTKLQEIYLHSLETCSSSADHFSNVFLVLCALADFFLPLQEMGVHETFQKIWETAEYWEMIQAGLLHHQDPLTRKRSSYLLRRTIELVRESKSELDVKSSVQQVRGSDPSELISNCNVLPIFFWTPDKEKELVVVWNTFFAMYEALDEVQIHVVQPLLPKMKKVIEAGICNGPGSSLLAISWFTVLLERSFRHESKTIPRWGVEECLNLDLSRFPLMMQNGEKFILGPLLAVLKEDYIYMKGTGQKVGECPYVVTSLQTFLQSAVEQLGPKQKKAFLQDLVSVICRQSWGPVPLVMVAHVLSRLQPCEGWDSKQLQSFRELLSSSIAVFPTSYRYIIQVSIFEATLNLLQCSEVSYSQFVTFLSLCNNSGILQRGGSFWVKVCNWLMEKGTSMLVNTTPHLLQEAVSNDMAAEVADGDEGLLGDVQVNRSAIMILLLIDVRHMNHEGSPAETKINENLFDTILSPLKAVLCCVGSHVYMPLNKADRALQLLSAIMDQLQDANIADSLKTVHVEDKMTELLINCAQEIYDYISRRLFSPDQWKTLTLKRLHLYLRLADLVNKLSLQAPETSTKRQLKSSLLKFVNELERRSLSTLNHFNKNSTEDPYNCTTSIQVLSWLFQQNLSDPMSPGTEELLQKLLQFGFRPSSFKKSDDANYTNIYSSEETGRLFSHAIGCKWQCIYSLLNGGASWEGIDMKEILQKLIDDMSIITGLESMSLMKCAALLISQVVADSQSLCCECLDASWCIIQDEWQHQENFWCLLSAFIKMAYQLDLLCQDETTQIFKSITKYTSLLFERGTTRPGLVVSLAVSLSKEWSLHLQDSDKKNQLMQALRNHHLSLFIQICLFGPIISKGLRIIQEVLIYFTDVPALSYIRDQLLFSSAERDPALARVAMINFIICIGLEGSTECREFLTVLVQALILKDVEITPQKKCYVINSSVHRLKQRMWQMALVVIPFIDEESAMIICHQLLNSLAAENQSSAKHLMEWLVVRLVHQFPNFLAHIWEVFHEITANNRGSVSPMLMILSHLGAIQTQTQKVSYYKKVIPLLLPWTMASSVSLRIQSQASLFKIWLDCKSDASSDVLSVFPAFDACMKPNRSVGAAIVTKLEGNFFLQDFHPLLDYSIETIFETLPFLTLVLEEEFIRPDLFHLNSPELWDGAAQLPISLYNGRDTLQKSQKLGKKKKEIDSPIIEFKKEDNFDFQKKIMPLRGSLVPCFEEMGDNKPEGRPKGKLVVVASLVDKMPNLGGICRTSEVFGVSSLTVGSNRFLEDEVFKSLSVTAQKWLECIEVKPSDLKVYLEEMRGHGYALIGVEQTANSRSLAEFRFPEKTVLVLGKERTGVPIEVIQMLDVCVEIPQIGYIRSLNVHVSASLLIWEYTRQQLL